MSKNPPLVPPFFSNFGKTAKDLFQKRYEYENQLKVINRSTQGITLESGAIQGIAGVRGYTKGTWVPPEKWGKVEAEIHTESSQTSKISTQVTQTGVPRTIVTLTAASKDKDPSFKRPTVGTADVEYTQDYFAVKGNVKSDTDVHKAEVQASFSYDNLAVGGIVNVNQNGEVTEQNFGAEYSTPTRDLVAALYTEKNASFLNASFVQRVTRDHVFAALFKHEIHGKQARTLTVGTEYVVDADTSIKLKGELPSGVVSGVVTHLLRNPRLKLDLAASFLTNNNQIAADKFGATVTLGDF